MRVAALTAYVVELPLRRRITHASATRDASANLIICCRLADGTEGWGESVPRPYVTGETVEGALKQLQATPLRQQLDLACSAWSDVLTLAQRFAPPVTDDPRGCYGNALRCAVELSLLDAFGKVFGQPISMVTNHVAEAKPLCKPQARVQYSATITAEEPAKERVSALKMRCYGFHQVKVKVGVAGLNDERRLRRVRRWLGPRVDLRLDANEAWQVSEVRARLEPLLPYGISCIEQPVPHGDVNSLAELRGKIPVPIMLDESLTSMKDAEQAVQLGTCDLFNIRLSKCGGFVRSLQLAVFARAHGLGYQLGCHPGESGLLSAAGRHFASSIDGIRYLEGSYDRHLLRELLTHEDITFGYGGWAPALTAPGLGVTVNPAALSRVKRTQQHFPVQV